MFQHFDKFPSKKKTRIIAFYQSTDDAIFLRISKPLTRNGTQSHSHYHQFGYSPSLSVGFSTSVSSILKGLTAFNE